ncbi:MAG: biotin transporter BioY [Spirochaetota bacterium]
MEKQRPVYLLYKNSPYCSETSTVRIHLLLIKNIFFSILFAIFTGLCAQLRFYLPFTPVPVTGQVFAVLLAGVFLGKLFGPLSQIFYVTLGLAGIPWFVVGPIGPTGGYIVGFIIAPWITSSLLEVFTSPIKHIKKQRYIRGIQGKRNYCQYNFSKVRLPVVMISMAAAVSMIYLLGCIQFSIYTGKSIISSFRYAILPFIPFDMVKVILASSITRIILKKGFGVSDL